MLNVCVKESLGRKVGKNSNRGWNKVLTTAFVNQIIYIYCRKKKKKEEGNGLDDVSNK